MELAKISKQEVKAFDLSKLKETEIEIRRTLARTRLEIFANPPKIDASSKKKLKKTLARILTKRSELLKNTSQAQQ